MSLDPYSMPPLFTHLDVSAGAAADREAIADLEAEFTSSLLARLVAAQERQNDLLERLVQQTGAAHRERRDELEAWKEQHPLLANRCRRAAERLSRVQADYLDKLTEEIEDNGDELVESEFLLAEFIDRFGPKMAHLGGMLQMLSQLSGPPIEEEEELEF